MTFMTLGRSPDPPQWPQRYLQSDSYPLHPLKPFLILGKHGGGAAILNVHLSLRSRHDKITVIDIYGVCASSFSS